MPPADLAPTFRFGDFELAVGAYQLRRAGRPVKLGRQPMDLLILLVERRGQLVTRGDIAARLWGPDVFVDVETGVNTAISKVRQALRDAADAPRFVETVAGKGYRFIGAVDVVTGPAGLGPELAGTLAAPATEAPVVAPARDTPPVSGALPQPVPRRRTIGRRAMVALLALAAAGMAGWAWLRPDRPAPAVTIAVLPFVNLDDNPERNYLATGLTDETSASLARIDPQHLTVKGRTQPYKGTTKTAAAIGQELSVDYLVESSIRAEGSRVRVAVALLRVRDQAHVWSQMFDRESTSLLTLQQELSTAIAEQVRLTLSPEGLRGVKTRQTENAAAFDAYLRGRDQLHRRTADGNRNAIALYRRAIALDPAYALAWSDLSFAYAASTINGDAPPAAVAASAREAALRAVTANPGLPEAQLALGYERWIVTWDWAAAEVAIRRAVELDPSDGTSRRVLGHLLSQRGKQAAAVVEMRRARELNPLDSLAWALSAQVAFQGRDLPEAIALARRAILLDPQLWIGYMQLAQAYESSGEHDLAVEALADGERLAGGNSKILSLRGYVLARMGRTAAAREVITALTQPSPPRYVPPFAAALVYAGLGEREPMFALLEQAYAARDVHLMYLPVDMKWDPYRTDPRFVDLLARCAFGSGR
jgi:TolB-like protein/DNA-binding winged helix-turn-helix (wHTH) protein/Flp pilus assembly protein TadD